MSAPDAVPRPLEAVHVESASMGDVAPWIVAMLHAEAPDLYIDVGQIIAAVCAFSLGDPE